MKVIDHHINGSGDPLKGILDKKIRTAIHQQMAIGTQYMLRGFLAVGWQDAIKSTGARQPERKMNALLRLVWDGIVLPLWHQRNDIMHQKENKNREKEDSSLAEKIQWYVAHRHEVMSLHDTFLAEIDVSTLHRLRTDTKREWVRHLEKARAAYENELKQKEKRQHVITRYFKPILKDEGQDGQGTSRRDG